MAVKGFANLLQLKFPKIFDKIASGKSSRGIDRFRGILETHGVEFPACTMDGTVTRL